MLSRLYQDKFDVSTDLSLGFFERQFIFQEFVSRRRIGDLARQSFTLELGPSDLKGIMKGALGNFIRQQCDSLVALKEVVATSVAEQKRLAGVLFE